MAEDYDSNLETIQALVRKHEGFEADLAAVKEQVRIFKTVVRVHYVRSPL